ncbi:MAG TPA: hypothetical protein VGN23_11410 [Verrucomicrobiae bacterium]
MSCLLGFAPLSGFGQSQVTVTLHSSATGPKIAPDFLGLSFEMQRVLADTNGYHFFSPTNAALIATFKTLGIHNLRVGGNTADRPTLPVPSRADIDSLFGFAKAANVKVIYTLRLNHGDPDADADTVNHIRRHYSRQLDYFAIGNEPNVYFTNYASYFAEWKRFADRISARSWGVKFSGPGVSPGHQIWTAELANRAVRSPHVKLATQHDYPGGDARKVKDPAAARDKILSPAMDEHYAKFANDFVPAVFSNHLPYRLEEANSFYDGGAVDVSDTYASALWALDYLWWWAQDGASGVNFHTGDTVAAREENKPCRYATFWTTPHGYDIHPIGYAEKMFSLGAEGRITPVSMTNLDDVNVVAYAVSSRKKVCVTFINREYAPNGRTVDMTIYAGLKNSTAKVIFLTEPGGDVSSKNLVSLGASQIDDSAEWHGKWTPVTRTLQGRFALRLPPATAALVEITAK